jgi:hypothetical protein
LSNSHLRVRLHEKDYRDLEDLGAGLPWKLVQGQIVVRNNNKNLNVARLIVDAGKGIKVWFADRDTTNLRKSNLIKTPGNGLHRTRDQLEDAAFAKFKRQRTASEYGNRTPTFIFGTLRKSSMLYSTKLPIHWREVSASSYADSERFLSRSAKPELAEIPRVARWSKFQKEQPLTLRRGWK